eukprot:2378912-Pyramimonas_sp.AAC.1
MEQMATIPSQEVRIKYRAALPGIILSRLRLDHATKCGFTKISVPLDMPPYLPGKPSAPKTSHPLL